MHIAVEQISILAYQARCTRREIICTENSTHPLVCIEGLDHESKSIPMNPNVGVDECEQFSACDRDAMVSSNRRPTRSIEQSDHPVSIEPGEVPRSIVAGIIDDNELPAARGEVTAAKRSQ